MVEGGVEPQAMRVDARLVREQLVTAILSAAWSQIEDQPAAIPSGLDDALAVLRADGAEGGEGGEGAPGAAELAARVARLGYACRMAEVEMFEAARTPYERLADPAAGGDAVEAAARLARLEPEERPDPGDAPSWKVPGPGGHVRHFAATDGIEGLVSGGDGPGALPPGMTPLEVKQAWMLGFFLRCSEEEWAS